MHFTKLWDSINTQLVSPFELAQVVARRTKQQTQFLGSNLTGCSFIIQCFFFFFFFLGGGGGLILLFSSCLIFFIPLTCIKHVYIYVCAFYIYRPTIEKRAISGPPPKNRPLSAHQQNAISIAFGWRANSGPRLSAG